MPDDVVQDVIAHELALACCNSRVEFVAIENGLTEERIMYARMEAISVDVATWRKMRDMTMSLDEGVDSESVDRWALAAGIKRVVNFDDPGKGFAAIQASMDREGR